MEGERDGNHKASEKEEEKKEKGKGVIERTSARKNRGIEPFVFSSSRHNGSRLHLGKQFV